MTGTMVLNMCCNMGIVLLIGFKGICLLSLRWIRRSYFYGKKFINWIIEQIIRFQFKSSNKFEECIGKIFGCFKVIFKFISKVFNSFLNLFKPIERTIVIDPQP